MGVGGARTTLSRDGARRGDGLEKPSSSDDAATTAEGGGESNSVGCGRCSKCFSFVGSTVGSEGATFGAEIMFLGIGASPFIRLMSDCLGRSGRTDCAGCVGGSELLELEACVGLGRPFTGIDC